MAFHVTYWDRLGWSDRFADPAHDLRQQLVVAARGGRVVYTPQVIVDGADWRAWPSLPQAAAPASVDLHLSLDQGGDSRAAGAADKLLGAAAVFTARVVSREPTGAVGRSLGGYWALLEDGHQTEVRAGENAGAVLRHDHVVRAYQPVAAWPAGGERSLRWQLPEIRGGDPRGAGARRVSFVVVDARTQQPLQALSLACP